MSNNGGLDLDGLSRRWSRTGPAGAERTEGDYTDTDCREMLHTAWADLDGLLTVARTVRGHHHACWVLTAADGDGHMGHIPVCRADGQPWPCPDAALFRG